MCKWIKTKIIPRIDKSHEEGDPGFNKRKVNIQDYAVNTIRDWGEVFCGFGAYSVQEVFFMAGLFYSQLLINSKLNPANYSGLSPFLTTLEVFSIPSRVGRLLLAMQQFAKFDIKDLWYSSSFIADL